MPTYHELASKGAQVPSLTLWAEQRFKVGAPNMAYVWFVYAYPCHAGESQLYWINHERTMVLPFFNAHGDITNPYIT